MEIFTDTIITALQSFDFAFCISVNVLTYITNKIITDLRGKDTTTWTKRLVLVIAIILMSIVWYLSKQDIKRIINSAILAPVFWSWVCKPIFKKFNIDYTKEVL